MYRRVGWVEDQLANTATCPHHGGAAKPPVILEAAQTPLLQHTDPPGYTHEAPQALCWGQLGDTGLFSRSKQKEALYSH